MADDYVDGPMIHGAYPINHPLVTKCNKCGSLVTATRRYDGNYLSVCPVCNPKPAPNTLAVNLLMEAMEVGQWYTVSYRAMRRQDGSFDLEFPVVVKE